MAGGIAVVGSGARERAPLIVAVALGLALRTFDLGGVSFDLDEATSAYTVSSLDRFATNIPAEIHPPLWYALPFNSTMLPVKPTASTQK